METDTIHHLLLMAFNHSNRAMTSRTRAFGLMPGQPKVLEHLAEHEGCLQRDIARACVMDRATVTGVLARMEESGLVERRPKQGDRRALEVRLSDGGWEAAERVACATAQSQRTAPDDVGYLLLTCPSCGTKTRIARPADAHTTIRLTCPKCRREHVFRLGGDPKLASAQKSPSPLSLKGCLLAFLAFEGSAVALVALLMGLGHLGIFLAVVIGVFIALLVYSAYVKRKSS